MANSRLGKQHHALGVIGHETYHPNAISVYDRASDINDGYKELANYIIIETVRDYKVALKDYSKLIPDKANALENNNTNEIASIESRLIRTLNRIHVLERELFSDWYDLLSGDVNMKSVVNQLRKDYDFIVEQKIA